MRHKHPLSRVSPLLGSETDSPRADSPCDSESGIETIISHMSTTVISPKNLENAVDNGAPSTEVGSADSSSGTKQTQDTAATAVRNEVLTDKEDIFMRTAPVNSILTDSNNQDDVTLMSMSGPLPGVPTDSSTSEEKTTNAGNGSQRLMARLSMNAKERRRTRIPVTQRLRNLPKHPPEVNSNDTEEVLVSSKAKHSVPFEWGGADAQHGLLLFMIHDNHMLGATVAGSILGLDSNKTVIVAKRPPPLLFLPGAPPAEYTDRKSGMGVMLEGKDDCGNSLFVLGTIVYSGNLSSIKGADGGNPRGSQCMVIGGLQAIKVRIKDIPTRSRPGNSDIQELDFAALPSDCYIPISDGVALRHFLQKCPSRVDVILDPSSENSWYPYWEGHRKMAPQFRSKGIGYIRLGDDMSMNGNAFLSTDAGETFLDDGGNSVVDSKVPAAPLNRLGSPLGRNTARMRSQNSLDAAIAEEGKFRPHTPGALGSPRGKSSYGGSSALKQIIQNLRQADVPTTTTGIIPANLTWSQRVDLLKRLQKELMLLSNNLATPYTPRTPDATSTSGEWVTDAFSIITDSLIKQKNPNVLKESLACVPLFSPWIPSAASMDVLPNNAPSSASANLLSWRSLFMEVVHCLRHANKSTGECAKAVLNELEKSRAITFRGVARLNPSPFTELLVGPIRGNSGRPAPSSSGSISTAANTARVTNWLTILAANVARESISASQSGGWADDDFYLGDHLTKAVKPLFFHREEATREGAVSLMAMLVCYDAVSTKRTQAPAPRLTESPRARSHSKGMLLDEAQTSSVVSSLPEEVSSTTLQILRDSEEASPKLIAKVVSEALQLIKKFKVEAMSSLNAGKTSGSKISRKPSDISDSNPGNEVLRRNSSGSGSHSVHFDSEKSLDDEWFEAKLTLQKPPCDGASWSELVGVSISLTELVIVLVDIFRFYRLLTTRHHFLLIFPTNARNTQSRQEP